MEDKNKILIRSSSEKPSLTHYTVIMDGVKGQPGGGHQCFPGRAFMGMGAWALDSKQLVHMCKSIAKDMNFQVTGEIRIYKTEPKEACRDIPFGYGIKFTPYES